MLKKWSFTVLALALLAALSLPLAAVHAQAPDPDKDEAPDPEGPAPIIVLTIFDPWLMVIGSDSPAFVLYEDGTVIRQEEWGEFVSVQLDEEELAAFTDALALGDDFFEMDDDFDMVPVTDLPSYQITAWDEEGARHRVWVYALEYWLENADEFADIDPPPAEFVRLYELMRDFEHEDLAEWTPEKFEVMLWPYEVSEATAWPAEWPGLDAPSTVERHEDSYSIFLDYENYWEDFQELGGPGKTYRLADRTFTSALRYPLPGEGWWMLLDED